MASMPQSSVMKRAWAGLCELWSAIFLHALVHWVWHVPALFRPVLATGWVHTLQHASFLTSARTSGPSWQGSSISRKS
jgi:cytochrome c oxidase assembly factor CtaG